MPSAAIVAEDQHARGTKREPSGCAYSTGDGGRACSEHFRDPTGTLRAGLLCQASRSSLNGRMRSNACHPRGSSQNDNVSSLHASMSGPWGCLQGDGARQTPAPATTCCVVQYMSSQVDSKNCYAIPLMCRHTCEVALIGPWPWHDSPKPARKATLLSPCPSTGSSYHSPPARLRKALYACV